MRDNKTKIWICVLLLVCVLCAVVFFLLKTGGNGKIAVVSVNGEELYRIDLSAVKEAYDIEISSEYGHNTIHVEPGAISVISSSCPDGICVNQGKLRQGGVPIICMPHRLVVQIEGSGIDA